MASRPGPGCAQGFKLAYVTLPADPLAQLKTAELTIARLEAERDRLESLVIRLGALAAEFDAEGVVQGVTEAARDLTSATLAMFVPTELAAVSQPTVICEPGSLGEVPEPSRVPILAGTLWRVSPVRLDDALQADATNTGYGRFSDGKPFRSWVGAPVRARYGDALGGLFIAHHCPQAFGAGKRKWSRGWRLTSERASTTWPYSRSARVSPVPCSRRSCPPNSPKSPGWTSLPATARPNPWLSWVGISTTCSRCGPAFGV